MRGTSHSFIMLFSVCGTSCDKRRKARKDPSKYTDRNLSNNGSTKRMPFTQKKYLQFARRCDIMQTTQHLCRVGHSLPTRFPPFIRADVRSVRESNSACTHPPVEKRVTCVQN